MNLQFINVKDVILENNKYILQKAVITKDIAPQFWYNWRYNKDSEIHKILTLRKEVVNDEPVWVVYRLNPINTNEFGTFSCSYTVRNISKLLPYQPIAVANICNSIIINGSALDGSDTGTGKSYVALAVCRELGLKPCIICKKSGFSAWINACKYMEIDPLYICNWESVKIGGKRFPYVIRKRNNNVYTYNWKLPNKTLLIFDEAHVANHEGTQNFLCYIASKGYPSLSLSATFGDKPVRMKPFFYITGIMDFDRYDSFLKSLGHFRNKYNQLESISDSQDMIYINKLLYPKYGYRISYDEPSVKKYFPEGIYQTKIINLDEKRTELHNKEYQTMLQKIIYYKTLGKQSDILVANMRYRQSTELLKVPVLVDMANDYIYSGYSVIIFVNFLETLSYLARSLNTKSVIFGNQDKCKINRNDVIYKFQNNINKVIICTMDAGGISLDLHDIYGNHPRISIICPTYNPITLKQVLGRTRRARSKTIPIMQLVYAANTIEEHVAYTVNNKLANISALNDGDLMEPDLFQMGYRCKDFNI